MPSRFLRSTEQKPLGGVIPPKGAQTSYSQALYTSVFSYRGHFILSNPSCFGIYFVGGGAV